MASTAAHLVDHVLPDEDLRQWVVTFPQPLPHLLAWHPELLRKALADLATVLEVHLQRATRRPDRLGTLGQQLERGAVPPSKEERPHPRTRRWIGRFGHFEVHAKVRIRASDREGRERLARYAARPGLTLGRLTLQDDGRVRIRFKRPWRNGTCAVVLRPEVFLLRLAALLLPPGVHAVRYHRMFAPAARGRTQVVPSPSPERKTLRPTRWIPWAALIERVFGRRPDVCPRCRQPMRVVATLQGLGRAWDAMRWIERHGDLARDGPVGEETTRRPRPLRVEAVA